ncbi:LOW QUALITY PROTEIN: hypothetical protein QYF61_013758 [Mycteria americana]|uniref:Reverse transcriptase n=1 Tax=Mycteria americana TaxID=33587 RepID=A0AAN7NUR0_MYCAM|nr:LOW QUALITY PROTEIN: hypothetical protein QYF61_013758 [Mycteria americana]
MLVDKLNMSQQCGLTAEKVNYILSCISKTAASRLREAIIPFYSALTTFEVQCPLSSSLIHKNDRDKLQQVQQKAPRMIGNWITGHTERLRMLGLLSLENSGWPRFLVARPGFGNPSPLTPDGKSGTRKTYLMWKMTRPESTNWSYASPRGLTGYTQKCRGSWLVSLQHAPSATLQLTQNWKESLIPHKWRDLDRLEKWANRNLMKFNKGKCKLLHLGKYNPMHQYMLGADQLESSSAEKDLGIMVDNKLTISHQRTLMAKTNSILGCIRSTARRKVILPLYSALVRPYLEYCVQFCGHSTRTRENKNKRGGNLLEQIQQTGTESIAAVHKPWIKPLTLCRGALKGTRIEGEQQILTTAVTHNPRPQELATTFHQGKGKPASMQLQECTVAPPVPQIYRRERS